jgi:SAM-dependent methyltransferase
MKQESSAGGAIAPEDVDFDAMYRGEVGAEDSMVVLEKAPWDIGEPQPTLVRLADTGPIRSDVLDVGCGLGENTLFLAERGYRVFGVDSSPLAIERARRQASSRGLEVEFAVADATRLDELDRRFNTVLDSALYHCLGVPERLTYSAALHRVTRPGAQLHLWCLSDAEPQQFSIPTPVSQDDLHANLGRYWNILDIGLTRYTLSLTRDVLRQIVAQRPEIAAVVDFDALDVDEHDRLRALVWQVHAERS